MTVWSIEVEVDKNKIYPQNKTKLLKHLILLFVAIVRVVAASSKISQTHAFSNLSLGRVQQS